MNTQTRSQTLRIGWALWLILVCGLVALMGVVGTVRARDGASPSAIAMHASANRQPALEPSTIITPTAAQDLAFAMGVDAADLISATLNGSNIAGVGIGTTPLGGYPTQETTFAILSTGLAASAELPNDGGKLGVMLEGLNNSQGNDLVQLALRVHVPANKNCLNVDFKFLSEEFPEYVGHDYNDTFTA